VRIATSADFVRKRILFKFSPRQLDSVIEDALDILSLDIDRSVGVHCGLSFHLNFEIMIPYIQLNPITSPSHLVDLDVPRREYHIRHLTVSTDVDCLIVKLLLGQLYELLVVAVTRQVGVVWPVVTIKFKTSGLHPL
jgi:hypothetical protein